MGRARQGAEHTCSFPVMTFSEQISQDILAHSPVSRYIRTFLLIRLSRYIRTYLLFHKF